jgi:hypothetical protein
LLFKSIIGVYLPCDAVTWASARGIVAGYGISLFGTNDLVTRDQTATILYRYTSYKNYDTTRAADLSSYTDAPENRSLGTGRPEMGQRRRPDHRVHGLDPRPERHRHPCGGGGDHHAVRGWHSRERRRVGSNYPEQDITAGTATWKPGGQQGRPPGFHA